MAPAQIHRTNVAQEWAIEAAKKRNPKDSEVPAEYQRHEVIFSEIAAHCFPPSRPEDHAIKLKPDAPDMIKCKTYLLTKPEMDAAKKFLDKNQAMGYIEPTNSPYSSPFFFIKKKDGTLRPVQDYREINKWTIRDVYPIPQITHILEQLQGKTVTVRSPCRRSVAVEKRGSREVQYFELQSRSLQEVEVEIVSGNIASRGASRILRRLRITQGKDGLWNT
jgi:hypothetical protein